MEPPPLLPKNQDICKKTYPVGNRNIAKKPSLLLFKIFFVSLMPSLGEYYGEKFFFIHLWFPFIY